MSVSEQASGVENSPTAEDETADSTEPVLASDLRERRDEEALRLSRMKVTYRQIMEQMGYSSTRSVHDAIYRARGKERPHTLFERRIDQDDALNLAARRLTLVLSTPMPQPDPETGKIPKDAPHAWEVQERWIKAALALIRLEERRARLWGLDAPQKRVVEHHVVSDEALAAEQDQLFSELVAMGIDPGMLPTVDDTLALLRANAIDTTAATKEDPGE